MKKFLIALCLFCIVSSELFAVTVPSGVWRLTRDAYDDAVDWVVTEYQGKRRGTSGYRTARSFIRTLFPFSKAQEVAYLTISSDGTAVLTAADVVHEFDCTVDENLRFWFDYKGERTLLGTLSKDYSTFKFNDANVFLVRDN